MMDKPEVLWQGKYIDVAKRGSWEYVSRKGLSGIVGMVPVTDSGKLVLIQQYRVPLKRDIIEFPAGLAGDIAGQETEAFELAARRELIEETGYDAQNMEFLFSGATSPGITDEQITVYLATGLKKVGPGGGDDSEDIQVHEVSLDKVDSWLQEKEREGCVIDLKLYCLMCRIKEIVKSR